MSTVIPITTTATTPTSTGVRRARAAIVATLLTLGALAVAVVVLWQPWGGRDQLAYADIAPHADAAWLGGIIDGLGFAAIGIALGLAVCMLAPAKGSALANIGAVMTGIGGVAFCAGMISFASFAWYATNTAALPIDSGTALMSYVEDNGGHMMGVQMSGFLLVTLGSLILMGALWRSRAVPRWLPIAYLIMTVSVFALDGVLLNVVQAVQTLSLIAVAFYAARTAGQPAAVAA